jgi:hypothetical protein
MVIYAFNFILVYFIFDQINIYTKFTLSIALIFISIYTASKINIIGLTGGIACGKSWACEYFKHNLGI